jgi:transposase
MRLKRISIDTSKHVFTLHGIDEQDRVVLRRDLRRGQVEVFFARTAPTEVALEAYAGAHYWARMLSSMGHRLKLIPPQYVKPFVKRGKNDRNDAEAISEAASRPSMRTVPVKTEDEQAATIIVKHREMLVGQRTQAINALRGHAAEFGIVVAKGCGNVPALVSVLANDAAIPEVARGWLFRWGSMSPLSIQRSRP